MQLRSKVVNGVTEWNHQPPGYEPVPVGETIQFGYVIKLSHLMYREYIGLGLIGNIIKQEGRWFRKVQK